MDDICTHFFFPCVVSSPLFQPHWCLFLVSDAHHVLTMNSELGQLSDVPWSPRAVTLLSWAHMGKTGLWHRRAKEKMDSYSSVCIFVYWRFYLRLRIGEEDFGVSEYRIDFCWRNRKLKVNIRWQEWTKGKLLHQRVWAWDCGINMERQESLAQV